MITDKDIMLDNIEHGKYCKHCGRYTDVKTIYVKSGTHSTVLHYCKKCWNKIIGLIWNDVK